MKGRHRPDNWPKVSEEIVYSQKRIMSWLNMPGLSVEHASVLLERLTHLRFNFLNRNDADFLKVLRDGLIEKGAMINENLLGVVAIQVEPRRQYMSHFYQINRFMNAKQSHDEKENKRLSVDHRASLIEWCNALTQCKIEDGARKRWWNQNAWINWFSLPGSYEFAAHLFSNEAGNWNGHASWADNVFASTDREQMGNVLDEVSRFEKLLKSNSIECDLRAWKINMARSAIESSSALVGREQLKSMFMLTDVPLDGKNGLDILTHAWLRRSPRFISKNGVPCSANMQELGDGLQFLCESGRLDPLLRHDGALVIDHENECSSADIDSIRTPLMAWALRDDARNLFYALPGLFPRRMLALTPFFHQDENIDARRINIENAHAKSEYVSRHLFKAISQKVMFAKQDVNVWWDYVFTGNLILSAKDAWENLSGLFFPRVAKEVDQEHWRALINYQAGAVECKMGPALLFEKIMQKAGPAKEGEWDCMVGLLDILQNAGLDFSDVESTDTSLFTREVSARCQQSKMQRNTPLIENRQRRPRL